MPKPSRIPAIDFALRGQRVDPLQLTVIRRAISDLSEEELEDELTNLRVYPTPLEQDEARRSVRRELRNELDKRRGRR